MAFDLSQYGNAVAQQQVARDAVGSDGSELVGRSIENATHVLYQKDAEERDLQKRQRYGVIEAQYGAELAKAKVQHIEDLRTGKISADGAARAYDERINSLSQGIISKLSPDDQKELDTLFQQKRIINRIEYDGVERQYRGERAVSDFNTTRESMQTEGLVDPSKLDLLAAKLETTGQALKPYLSPDDYQRIVSGGVNDLAYQVLVTNINSTDSVKQLKGLRDSLADGKQKPYLTEKRAPLMNAIDTQIREIKRAELEANSRNEAELLGTVAGMKNVLSNPVVNVDVQTKNQIDQTAAILLQSGKPSKRAQGAELRAQLASYDSAQKLMTMPIPSQRDSLNSLKAAGIGGDVVEATAQASRIQYLEKVVNDNESAAKSDPLAYSAQRQKTDLMPLDYASPNVGAQMMMRQEPAAASAYWTGQQAALITKPESVEIMSEWEEAPAGHVIKAIRSMTEGGLGRRPEVLKTLDMLQTGKTDYSKAAIYIAQDINEGGRSVGELMITGNKALAANSFKIDNAVDKQIQSKVAEYLGNGTRGSAGNQAYADGLAMTKQVYTALMMEGGSTESVNSVDDKIDTALTMALGHSATVNGAKVLIPRGIAADDFESKAMTAIAERLSDPMVAPNMKEAGKRNSAVNYQLLPKDVINGVYALSKPSGETLRAKNGLEVTVTIK